ncbi:MAG TPA: HEPN domain-containing protein [Planctomycetota bacterium]|nr:HEPN domain-containing protein [Planctomycetota bacterium]
MPPLQRFEPDDPREWLSRARSNLLRARTSRGIEGLYLEDICFDAQQAAEKAIKAVLVWRRVDFPKTHDLGVLLTLVRDEHIPLPDELAQARRLSEYAVSTRYPSRGEPASEEDCDSAIRCAEAVLRWATDLITPPPSAKD